MKGQTFWQAAVDALVGFCVTPDDDENERLQKTILILTTIMMSVFAAFWGIFYLFFAEPLAASIPLFAALYSGISLTILRKNLNFPFFRSSQLLLMLLLPFLLMTVLGGFKNGSAVIFWALFSPIVALLGGQSRRAIYWFTSYIVLVVFSGLIHPYLRVENNLPEHVIVTFYILHSEQESVSRFLAAGRERERERAILQNICLQSDT